MNLQLGPVRWWVGLYTSGLDPVVRDRRRAEIASDLWDQVDAFGDAGRTPAAITMAVWLRCLSGMLDDVFWRREQPRASRAASATTEGSRGMFGQASRGSMALPVGGVAIAIGAAIAVVVIDNIQFYEQSNRFLSSDAMRVISYGLVSVGLVSLVGGFAIMRSRPAVGAVLAVGGSVVAGVMVYWLIVPLIISAAISIYAVRRARRIAAAGRPS